MNKKRHALLVDIVAARTSHHTGHATDDIISTEDTNTNILTNKSLS